MEATLNGAAGWLGAADRHIRWGRARTGHDWLTVGGPLTDVVLARHARGDAVVGAFPAADGVAYFGVIDIDLHLPEGQSPTAEQVAANERYAVAKARELESRGGAGLLVRGHDQGSYHLFFRVTPMAADRLGRWLKAFVSDAATVGIHVDAFPSETGDGNAVRLPGRHHRRPDQWSAAWTGSGWAAWPAPLERLTALPANPARHFEAPRPDPRERVEPGAGARQARPGDVFNLLVPVEDVLAAHGWAVDREDGDRVRFTRPGKDGGVSASVKGGTVWVFTSSVPGLPKSEKGEPPYTAFGLVAHLCYGGDFRKAAADLARRGFCPPPAGRRESEESCVGPKRGPRFDPIPAYVPFPTDSLPAPWGEFIRQGAAALRCDDAFVAVPLIAVLGGAIGTSRRVHVGAEWFEPAVAWTSVVAESGDRKSPGAALSMDLVTARQRALVKRFKDEMAEYRRAAAEYKRRVGDDPDGAGEPPVKPTLARVLVSDVTIEKLAGLLDDNRRGLTLYRDELAGWLGSFTRYKGAAGGSDEPAWLSIHRADTLMYDRKTGDKNSVFVPRAAVSITGGIQPGTLARLAGRNLFESGLVARILFAMPPRRPKVWTDRRIGDEVRAAAVRSLDALYALAGERDDDGEVMPVVVPLSPAARERMRRFVNEWGGRQFETDGDLAAAMAKLEAFAPRFALIHHLTTTAPTQEDTNPVSLESLEAGIRLAEWFVNETARVYAVIQQSDEQRQVRLLVDLVRRVASRHGGRVTVAQLQNANSRRFQTADDAKLALEQLAALGLGEWQEG
ncbi:DUF3987 domain-containing protein, partial [bacterium]|nr:DUF3987 domain-containing protein [bacterium]